MWNSTESLQDSPQHLPNNCNVRPDYSYQNDAFESLKILILLYHSIANFGVTPILNQTDKSQIRYIKVLRV